MAAADIASAWQAVYAQSAGFSCDDLAADGWMSVQMFSKKYKITIDTARGMLERNANLERRSFRVQTEKSVRQVNFFRPKKVENFSLHLITGSIESQPSRQSRLPHRKENRKENKK